MVWTIVSYRSFTFFRVTSVVSNPDRFDKLIRYGQSLQTMLTDMELSMQIKDDKNTRMVQDAFSLLAYADPWSSPVGGQLDPKEREIVSRELNSAILESKQLAPYPPLERSLHHTKVLLKIMARNDLGACAFASVDEFLR